MKINHLLRNNRLFILFLLFTAFLREYLNDRFCEFLIW
nr:MAG TPA: hypothetical protein [Caudoviricetes sp.]